MILAIVISFLTATALTATACHLAHNHRYAEMKDDTLFALDAQANDSYRTGYMNACSAHARKVKKNNVAKTNQILVTV